ncbi:Nuclear control of ATPase protein 2 [Tilletia horrida]|uniref:Nuclear control of ATPase protein 2 n=1 Tax=Tilletia horrida TaxID=155126 RepID=A0AAN6G9W1_9BASI|nr:Nuclear control of ATPase protein 2 [Tilletia horrida]
MTDAHTNTNNTRTQDSSSAPTGRHQQHPSSSSSSSLSSSYALDALRRLGTQLDSIERQHTHAQTQKQQDDGSSTTTTTTTQIDTDAREKSSSSSSSSNVLDISTITSSHPSPAQLHAILTAQLQPALALSPGSAETVFALARVALATYTSVLELLLHDAHALERTAWAWHDIHDDDNHLAALLYLVQTLPARTLALSHTALAILRRSSSSSPSSSSSSTSIRSLLESTLRSLKKSPTLVTTSLFPLSASLDLDADLEQSNSNASGSSNNNKGTMTIGIGRAQLALKPIRAPRAFDPVRLAAHEAKAKAQILLAERDELATQLGTLAQSLPTLVPSSSSSSSSPSSPQSDEAAAVAALQVASRAIRQVQHALGEQDSQLLSEGAKQVPNPSAIYDALDTLLSRSIPAYTSSTHTSLSTPTSLSNLRALGPPSLFLRLWLPAILLPTSALVLRSTILSQWGWIVARVTDAKETIRGFWIGWVVQPGAQLLETLRRGENERGLIIAKESLSSDLKSLERMVTSFSAEKYKLSPQELDELASKVKDGDLTSVLRVYEDEMRSPLKSALTGSLLRALLIQVQKAKVDLEVAMSGIDRLLRSQELLIGAVGLAPALGIVWVAAKWALGGYGGAGAGGKAVREGEALRLRAWEAMREIDKLLSLPPSHSEGDALPPLTHGLLLLHLSFLRSAAAPLTAYYVRQHQQRGAAHSAQRKATAKKLRRAFLEDIRELEAAAADASAVGTREGQKGQQVQLGGAGVGVGLGWQVRRATIQRMWASWPGLLVPRGVGMA